MSELLQKSNAILEKIKNVLETVSAEVLIQKLSKALETEIETVNEKDLESFILEINEKESSITSLEYLESLINPFDRAVKLYLNSELYCKYLCTFKVPVRDFTELNQLFYCATYTSSLNILVMILQLDIDHVEMTPEEESKWKRLLLESADVIKQFLKWHISFQSLSLLYSLQMRSCVQCILDLLVECPAEYGILSKELDKINDCKKILDNLIERTSALPLTDDSDFDSDCEIMIGEDVEIKIGDDGKSYTEICAKDDDDEFISKMPPSHTWWQKLKRDAA